MRPLPFLWPYSVVFWTVFFWAFLIEARLVATGVPTERQNRSQDAGSVWIVILANYLAMFLAFFYAVRARQFNFTSGRLVAFWCGIALIIAGSLLRRHCFQILGQYFTAVVQVRANQPVIDVGAYRLLRHPSYTAGLIMFAGIGLALGNWASLVAAVVIPWAAYAYRVRAEERALLATLGEPYRAYMRRTKRFIPYVI
ncbi:MAG TPA: isoprenylcysteine carboxylmethyltransferase family protein [Gemmatimonadaceae bacterium]|jgi:protein-S-isoprenylcysteine O-methyltransferase Ste14